MASPLDGDSPTMPCILFAWEMGANWGHITRDLPLARLCRDAGFEVVMAVPDLRLAASLLRKEGFSLVASPTLRSLIKRTTGPINYADMLMHEGWDDIDGLEGAVAGWRSLIRLSKARAMVFNHAPAALLATRLEKIPVLLTGTGFELPPQQTPLPSFRPWQALPIEHLVNAENQLLNQINKVLTQHGAQTLCCVADLFATAPMQLATLPELDPFGPRPDASYIGPIYTIPDTPAVSWRVAGQKHAPQFRVFVYMRPNIPHCERVLEALQARTDIEVIGAIPGLPPEWRARFPALRLLDHTIDLQTLLPRTDLVITYGPGTLASALLAGVPVLLLPHMLEQYLTGLKLEQTGAGAMYRQSDTVDTVDFPIRKMLEETSYKQAARKFADRYHGMHADAVTQRQFEELNRLMRRGASDALRDPTKQDLALDVSTGNELAADSFIQIEVTTICNFKCFYCAGRTMPQKHMRREVFESILEKISGNSGMTVSLQGEGEPMLHPEFWGWVEAVCARGLKVTTISNGSLIDAVRCAKHLDNIGISIDTLDAKQAHNLGRYNLPRVLRNLQSLCEAMGSHRLRVHTVDFGQDLRPLRDFVKKMGLQHHIVQPLQDKEDYTRNYPEADVLHAASSKSRKIDAYSCSFLEMPRMRYFNIEGIELPCCFIKDLAGYKSIDKLKESLANKQVPSCCAGCRYLQ